MRALTFDRRLSLDPRYPDPRAAPGDVLVRVHLAGISADDLRIAAGATSFRGVPGHEFVGTVEEGPPAWNGKRVVGEGHCVCRQCDLCLSGLASHCRRRTVIGVEGRDGCLADWLAVPERNLHAIPDTISDEEAVFVPLVAAAYQVLAQSPIETRDQVSVVGAGRLGLLVAQVLKTTGCKLTVVGRNRDKLLLCEKKGVQAVLVGDLTPKHDRDVVVECSGSAEGLRLAMALVRPRGTIVLKSKLFDADRLDLSGLVRNEIRLTGNRDGPFGDAINALARQAVEVRSMVSRVFPLAQGVSAFEAAARPENIKILVKVNPP